MSQQIAFTDRRTNCAETTAFLAVVAGLPGLGLTAVAAANANALTLYTDLMLTALDVLLLVAAWVSLRCSTRSSGGGAPVAVAPGSAVVCTLVAACMIMSMFSVGGLAAYRLAEGAPAPTGPGILAGIVLNVGFAVLNAWILHRWRRRRRVDGGDMVRAQVCLFADKLTSNLIIVGSLAIAYAFPGGRLAGIVDSLAGLLMAAATARWAYPVLMDRLRSATCLRSHQAMKADSLPVRS